MKTLFRPYEYIAPEGKRDHPKTYIPRVQNVLEVI